MASRKIRYKGRLIAIKSARHRSDYVTLVRRDVDGRWQPCRWPKRYYAELDDMGEPEPGVFAASVKEAVPELLEQSEHRVELGMLGEGTAHELERSKSLLDLGNWTEADEAQAGLGLLPLPLWYAGKLGVSLGDALRLARYCKTEPGLQNRLEKARSMAVLPELRGRNKEAKLKAATLLYRELEKEPGLSVSTAAKRVIALKHPGVKDFHLGEWGWKSIVNLYQDKELMQLAAYNSRIWP